MLAAGSGGAEGEGELAGEELADREGDLGERERVLEASELASFFCRAVADSEVTPLDLVADAARQGLEALIGRRSGSAV